MNEFALRLFVRNLITEAKKDKQLPKKATKKTTKSTSVINRLQMIDEAGNQAALQAKINQVKKDLEEAHMIKSAIPSNLGHFVDHEIIGDLHDDLEASIKELEEKKAELESELKELDEVKAKPSAGMTKKEKSAVAKKAHKGGDIGKPGKGFEKVAKAAEKQYGSKEAGQKVAAAAMWKNAAK